MADKKGAEDRSKARVRRAIRKAANGRPRLSVFRSSKQIYAQVIDDERGHTVASASSIEMDIRGKLKTGADVAAAKEVGRLLAERAVKAGVKEVIFCDQPDAADEVDVKTVARKLIEVMRRLRPVEIYTLHEELDRHKAHREAGALVREAVEKSGLMPSGGIWAYEVWGPFARWDRIEYIDAYVEKKKLAIAAHQSQVDVIPYGEGMLGLNRWRAVYADPMEAAPAGSYAEVFIRVVLEE